MISASYAPIIEAARECYDLGYMPVPVLEKAPVFIPGYQQFSTGERSRPEWGEIESWFINNPTHDGFALCCGTQHFVDGKPYRLIGLDVDLRDTDACMDIMKSIPPSTAVKKGSKGFTAFYLVEEDQANSHKLAGVYDWLAKKKVTVMPPSRHPDLPQNAVYEWIDPVYLSPIRDQSMVMPAPHLLPTFDEDDYEQMREACEEYVPEIETQVATITREWDGSYDQEPCSAGWINDQLMLNFGWLQKLLNAADVPYDVKAGKVTAVPFMRDSYYDQGPSAGQVKPLTDRKFNWHFVPVGWCGTRGGIKDHGDDEGGRGWTPLDVIAALTTGEDIRGQAKVPDAIWRAGMEIVEPDSHVLDDELWKGIIDAFEAAQAEREQVAMQEAAIREAQRQEAKIEARAEEMRAEAARQEAEAENHGDGLAEIFESDDINVRDRKIEGDVYVGAIGPVPRDIIESAPGLIGLITQDLRRRYPTTPPSLFVITALMMVSTLAARRYESFTPKRLSLNLYSVVLGTTGIGKGEVVSYLDKLFAELEKVQDKRLWVADRNELGRYAMHENDQIIGPNVQIWDPNGGGTPVIDVISQDSWAPPGDEPVDPVAPPAPAGPIGKFSEPGINPMTLAPYRFKNVFEMMQGPGNFTGDSGFIGSLYSCASRLFFIDEFGSKFGVAVKQDDANNPSWFASARELMYRTKTKPKAYGMGSENKNTMLKKSLVDVSPSLFGVSTPEQFTRGLSDNLTEDGTLNRYLLFQEQRPKKKAMSDDEGARTRFAQRGDRAPIPDEIIAGLVEVLTRGIAEPGMVDDFLAANAGGKSYKHMMEHVIFSGAAVPDEGRIEVTFEGRAIWSDLYGTEIGNFIHRFMSDYEDRIERAYAADDHYTGNALVRGSELTLRVAVMAAVAEGRSEMSLANLEWAHGLVAASVQNLVAMTNSHMVSERSKDEERLLSLIEKAYLEHWKLPGGRKRLDVYCGGSQVSLGKIRRAFFNNKGEDRTRFNNALRTLVQSGDVAEPTEVREPGSDKPIKCVMSQALWDRVLETYTEKAAAERAATGQ
ncbi:MAG: bifunctional DNA primase/polymerase [Pseudomonadota bacterium]